VKVAFAALGVLVIAFGAFIALAVRRDRSHDEGRAWAYAYAALTVAAGLAAVSVLFDATPERLIVGLVGALILAGVVVRWALRRKLMREDARSS
jgi:hypothetical protein